MADKTNTATQNESKKKPTTAEAMTAYRTFATPADANAYLAECAEKFSDFGAQKFVMIGVDTATGEYDPAIYHDGMEVRVAVIKNRQWGEKDGKRIAAPSTVRAVVVAPSPTVESFLSDDAGKDWVKRILSKEINHVMARPIREAENVDAAASEVPTTRENYITSQRDSGAFDAYNDHYKTIGDAMAKKFKVWDKARRLLTKSELRKALESKPYALEYFPSLEDRGEKPSLFVMALQFGSAYAKSKGADSAIFDKWLATRDSQTLDVSDDEDGDEEDVTLDDLTADFIDADESGESGEQTEEQPAA
jgi:hypothetical protein